MDLDMKCAVVGSGPSIVNNLYGGEIDSHDCIIRCNRALTDGYEKHVGSRTDRRVLNLHCILSLTGSITNLEHYVQELENWESITIKDVMGDDELLYLKDISLEEVKHLNSLFSNDMVRVPEDVLEYSKIIPTLTCGFCAIMIASKEFKEVNCFGFDFFANLNYNHYYEKVTKSVYCHNHEEEENLLKKLPNVKFIR
tara:strand:+ start:10 stop:600 length:591 start_codon:yes stop_codon:yes gene_type:complete